MIQITDQPLALNFVRDFSRNFHAKVLHLTVYTESQLERLFSKTVIVSNYLFSLRHLISDFPRSDCVLELWFLPDIETLLSLPPLKEVKIPHEQVAWGRFGKAVV